MKTKVMHWRHEDGWRHWASINGTSKDEFDEELTGWHCWVYTDDKTFETWMENNMVGEYDATWRFNSGDPMITVCIKTDEDANLFKLRWM